MREIEVVKEVIPGEKEADGSRTLILVGDKGSRKQDNIKHPTVFAKFVYSDRLLGRLMEGVPGQYI